MEATAALRKILLSTRCKLVPLTWDSKMLAEWVVLSLDMADKTTLLVVSERVCQVARTTSVGKVARSIARAYNG